MVNKQHAQFSDENGNIFYLENETEDVLDPSGKPLSNGGDLSEASVTFTPDATRKLPQSGGRFKAFLGSIVKFLSDLTEVAFSGNYSDLEGKPTIPPLANNCTTTAAGYGLDARQGKVLMDKANQLSSETDRIRVYVGSDGKLHFVNKAGADSVLPFKNSFSMTWHHNAQANVVAGLYSSIDLPGSYDTLKITPKTVSPSNTTIALKVNGETKQTITSAGATIGLTQYNADIIKLEIFDPYNGRVEVVADIELM